MNMSKKFKVNLLIFLIFGTLFLGIMPIIKINDNSEILRDEKDFTSDEITHIKPKSAGDFDPDIWWDLLWSYRVNINASGVGRYTSNPINFTNRLIEKNIDFTQLLQEQEDTGTFDENSIRVIEVDTNGNFLQESPSQFDKDTDYDPNTKASGVISWVMNGTTLNNAERLYFIYFDTIQNGAKQAPNYNTGINLMEISKNLDYSLENDKFRVSMQIQTTSYHAHVYELFNKHSGVEVEQHCTGPRWGWMSYSWSFNGVSGTPTGINTMAVVSDGSVKKTVKMIYDHANFLYERFYTINYLDDTVRIQYIVHAKNNLNVGYWTYAVWWNPSYGTSSYTAPDSAYGFGGHNWGYEPISGLDSQYTDRDSVGISQGWYTTSSLIRAASWFCQWNRQGEPGYSGPGADPNKYEGVGTVWGNVMSNYTDRYGYYNGYEGRYPYWRFRTPETTANNWFEMSVWGIIFNSTQGDYVEKRAPGLQDRPLLSDLENSQSSGKILTVKAEDLDNDPIMGAEIELYNSTMHLVDNLTTDSIGNVTYRGLQNGTHILTAYYVVNKSRFMIKNDTIVINLPISQRQVYHTLENCNLTSLHLLASDKTTGYSLYGAYMTIRNSSNGFIIGATTDTSGWTHLKLPADIYNISAFYQGTPYTIILNITGKDTVYRDIYNFTLTKETRINVTLSISDDLTDLTIKSVDYGNNNWDHDEKISSQPYLIGIYKNDTVNITVFFEKVADGSGIATAEDKFFEIYKGEQIINDTNNNLNDEGGGNYSFLLYSCHYTPGSYSIKVNLSKTSYQDSVRYINFNIKNHTSSILKIDAETDLDRLWNQNITLFINYTMLIPEVLGISGATVNWTVLETIYNGTMFDNGNGNYSLSFNTTVLDVGTYQIYVRANKTNIDLATKTFTLTVNEIPTFINWEIEDDYEVTSTFLKIARGELTSIILNYSRKSTGSYIGPYGDISTLFVNLTHVEDDDYPPIIFLEDLLDGRYKLTIDASEFSAGDYQLTFLCHEAHYEDQIELLTLRILDSWATTVDLIKPPSFYPWSNNASFIINYYCTEDPRTNRLLSGAAINTLGISVKVGQVFQPFIQLGVADKGDKWGYFDLASDPLYGAGYYQIWFNTSYVNVSESTAYYVSPTLQKTFYSTYTYNPYVWVRPAYTILTPISDKVSIVPVKHLDFYLDQESEITAIYNVSDSISDLNGKLINGATVSLEIRNDTLSNELIKTGSFTVIDAVQNPGEYKYTLKADLLGNFTLSITAIKENYSGGIASIDFSVDTKPINYTLSENIRGTIFFTPQNKEVLISISLNDIVHSTTLSGATIEVGFEGQSYLFHESSTSGVYAITFNDTMLAGVEPDKTYTVQIKAIKTNYTTEEFTLSLDIGLPVDPLLGIPYLYWLIIGATASVALGIYGTTKYIKYKRIPEFIKKLNKVKKGIKSKKSISESLATETKMEYMLESLGDRWEKLGISLEEILGIKGKKLGEIKKESIEAEEKPPEPEKEYTEIEEKPPESEKEYPEVEKEPSEPEMEYPEVEKEPSEPEMEYPEPEREPSEPEKEPPEPEREYPEPEKEPSEPEREYPEPEKEPSEIEKEPPETEKEYDENQEGGNEE